MIEPSPLSRQPLGVGILSCTLFLLPWLAVASPHAKNGQRLDTPTPQLIVFGEVVDVDDDIQVFEDGENLFGFAMLKVRVEWASVPMDVGEVLIHEPESGAPGCGPMPSEAEAKEIAERFDIRRGERVLFFLNKTSQDVCGRFRKCGSKDQDVWLAEDWFKLGR